MSHHSDARTRYLTQLESSLQRLTRTGALPRTPWRTLALNAAFYLDRYLPPESYHAALDRAIHNAAEEAARWPHDSQAPDSFHESFETMVAARESRAELYRAVFEQAARTGSLTQIVLAQHACEIAEVVDQPLVPLALRMSQMRRAMSHAGDREQPGGAIRTPDQLIEQLCRALLTDKIASGRFTLGLLATHAARRAHELVDPAFDAPLQAVAQRFTPVLESFSSPPPHTSDQFEFARRAVLDGRPWTILLAEAGLVEAEGLRDSQRSLLLAALDHALPRAA